MAYQAQTRQQGPETQSDRARTLPGSVRNVIGITFQLDFDHSLIKIQHSHNKTSPLKTTTATVLSHPAFPCFRMSITFLRTTGFSRWFFR